MSAMDAVASATAQPDRAPAALQLRLFGGIQISVNGVRISDIATRKAEALLVFLACERYPHQRETLAELFWNDLPAERAAGNLRLILTYLRKHCEPFLDITRQTIGLRSDVGCWLDLEAFADLAARPSDPQALRQALELYRGDFLQGFHLRDAQLFSAWQAAQEEHWRSQLVAVLQALLGHALAWSHYSEGIAWAKRLLQIDPLDEATHRQLMLLYARGGQRNAAVRQYASCKRLVRQGLNLEPEAETETLYRRIRRMPEQRPHNLPPWNGLLIGRAAEQAQIGAWLADPAERLLSVVGPGGSGKTQLGLSAGWRAVREHLGPCGDGVWYVALLGDSWNSQRLGADALLVRLAEVLQIRINPRQRLDDQIVQQLNAKELLLILDNAELLDQGARRALGSLVQRLSLLRLLVLSRERLKLQIEQVLGIAGLAYPEAYGPAVTALPALGVDLAQYEAVQLLLASARRLRSATPLEGYSAAEQTALGQICRMVHGLPLALELVAPWLRLRLPSEIVRDIGRDIDLLAADLPELPVRHHSLRAAFVYSWNLIGAGERTALARLACFPASFSAAAAEAIAAVRLPELAALHDASLVQLQRNEAHSRYLIHPLLRQLAYEQEPCEHALAQARHADFFGQLASRSEDGLRGPQGAELIVELEREIDNLRAGWQWAIAQQQIELLGQYSVALHDFLTIRSWQIEGCQLFGPVAELARVWAATHQPTPPQRAALVRVLSCYAQLEQIAGDIGAAEAALRDALALLDGQPFDRPDSGMFLNKQLGLIAYGRGDYREALEHLQRALRLAQRESDPSKLGDILLSAAAVLCAQGSWTDAEQIIQRCLDCYQRADFAWGLGHAQRFAGICALGQGQHHTAHRWLQQSLDIAGRLGSPIGEALALDQLGLLELREGRLEQSQQTLQRALALFQELGVDLGVGRAHCHLGRVALAQQNPQQAERHFQQALQLAQQIAAPPLQIEATAGLLQLQLAAPSPEQAHPAAALSALLDHPACTAETRATVGLFASARSAHAGQLADLADPS
jgi:DNA-binding SARP family transcriptional activator/predicted ATPase